MDRTSITSRERGGAILWTILAIVLIVGGYYGYKALVFYRANVAPAVAEVSKIASAVKSAMPSYTVTREPGEIAAQLQSVLRIAPPDGYEGAFGLAFEALGNKLLQVVALAPKGVPASQIFEGGNNEIRFNPGRHTIFLAAIAERGDPDEMRESIAKLVSGHASSAPLTPTFIEAGGRRVAAYVGTAQNFGATNRMVFVFLDEGRLLHAVGPADGFDDAALERTLAAIVAVHPANALLYAHIAPASVAKAAADPCGIPGLPDDFDVVVVSVYKGSTPLDIVIDKSGHDVTREEVVVGVMPKPVVLLLMGYDPIVWNVGQTADANIVGVLAQGYHRQAVIGLPKTVPLVTYSSEDGPNACRYFRAESATDGAAARRVRELFGRGVGTFMNRKAGERFTVGEVSGEPSYSPDTTLASVALPGNVMPGGQRGIDRLVKEKAIRPATEEEVSAWIEGAARRKGLPVAEYRRSMEWRLGRNSVYVALTDFDLPAGLAGANARTFIIPPGTSRPGGPQGHCTFLAMEGYQCYGTGCS